MKHRTRDLLAMVLAGALVACGGAGSSDSGPSTDTADTADTAYSGDGADTGETWVDAEDDSTEIDGGEVTDAGQPPPPAVEAMWAMAGHDSRHTGRSPYVGAQRPDLAWKIQLKKSITKGTSPVINSDGVLVVASGSGTVFALDAEGTSLWTTEVGEAEKGITNRTVLALAPDGTLYAVTSIHDWPDPRVTRLHALAPDGTKKWSVLIEEEIRSNLTVDASGRVYLASKETGNLHVIQSDGSVAWVVEAGDGHPPSIADDGTVISGGNTLQAHDSDGTLLWEVPMGEDVSSPAIGDDGTVYVCGPSGVYAFTSTGTQLWLAAPASGPGVRPVIAQDGTLYVRGSGDTQFTIELYALNADGTIRWTRDDIPAPTGHVTVDAAGTVYVAGGGLLTSVSPDGVVNWMRYLAEVNKKLTSGPVIAADGRLVVVSEVGRLLALGSGGPCEGSPADCNDQDPCTVDRCVDAQGCTHTLLCDDGNPCTADTCGADGACTNDTMPDDSACDAGLDCAGPGTCQDGVCQLSDNLCGLAQSPWPKPGHDNRQTNRSSQSPAKPVSPLWTAELDDSWVLSEPLLDESGTVLLLTHYQSHAVGADGTLAWDAAGDGPFAAVRADGTSFNTANGELRALDEDGNDLWSFTPLLMYAPGYEAGLAIADDGTLYLGGSYFYLYALDPNGQERWRFDQGDARYGAPSIAPSGQIVVGSGQAHRILGISPDGELVWEVATEEAVFAAPLISDLGIVYAVDGDGTLYAVESDGTLRWSLPTAIQSPLSLGVDGRIYGHAEDSKLVIIVDDGQANVTTVDVPSAGRIAIAADGTLYASSSTQVGMDGFSPILDNQLHGLDADGNLLWTHLLGEAIHPAYPPSLGSDGRIYVGADNLLHAFGP